MMLRSSLGRMGCRLIQNREWSHLSLSAPMERVMDLRIGTELDGSLGPNPAIEAPHVGLGNSMELMAVPKKKVSPYKRGLRNGPKALKPVPVIIRCKSCGRVKLPHFYCCSGDRGSNTKNDSTS